jgi:peptide/nickel transport system substrate-binding protein
MGLNSETNSKRVGGWSLIKGAKDYTDGNADSVVGITVIDDHTIKFDMEAPNVLFLNEVSFRSQMLPEHILGDVPPAELSKNPYFTDSFVGSGPFKFVQYVQDQFLEMEAYPDFWRGRPHIDRIIINVFASLETMEVAMRNGEIDFVMIDGGRLPMDTYRRFAEDPGFRVVALGGGSVLGYGFNLRNEHLQDKRLRQAFLYALDREKLVQTLLGGVGTIPNSFMDHPFYQKPEWADLYPYDPDKAKELLAEMGWDSERELTVNILPVASEDQRAMLAAQQQMLAEVGIKITFAELDVSVWVEQFYETHEFELEYVTHGTFSDPDGFLNWHMHTNSKNAFGYASPEFDAKILAGRQTVDREERIRIYQEIAEEMLEEVPLAPVYRESTLLVYNRRIAWPQIDPMVEATDFSYLGPGKFLLDDEDVLLFYPEQWDLK